MKKKKLDQAYVADSFEKSAVSSVLMAMVEEQSNFLFQGFKTDLKDLDLWYLDIGATNHMYSRRSYFSDLNETA